VFDRLRRHPGGWLTLLASGIVLLVLVGCPTDPVDDDDTSDGTAALDLDADTDRDGELAGDEAEDADEELAPGAIAAANVDDDNLDGTVDCEEDLCDEENDNAEVSLHDQALAELGDGESVVLSLDGDGLSVWADGELVLGEVSSGELVTEWTVPDPEAGAPELRVEGMDFAMDGLLAATIVDGDGAELDRDEIAVSTPPFMMFNHLDPSEHLWVLDDGSWNLLFRDGLKEALGEDVITEIDGTTYGHDVWLQDEIEFGYQQLADGAMPLVLDSIRNRPLDAFPEAELLGPDFGHLVRGQGPANSLDSFGNLECTPPITVDGVEYPFGRIYYGGKPGGTQMTEPLRTFLDEQEVQSPAEIDSTWLLVGHVDEFMVWVPDASSDKGFKLLVADWEVTRTVLESVDPLLAIPRFEEHYGYATVGELLESNIPAYNEDIDAVSLQPTLLTVMEAFGLEESDIIPIPGVWEEIWGGAVALVPGMANLAVYDEHLLIADPFLRTIDEDINGDGVLTTWAEDINASGAFDTEEDANGNGVLDEGEDINGNGLLDTEEDRNGNWQLDEGEDFNGDGMLNTFRDPFQEALLDVLPDGLVAHFLDDWNNYHLMEGEVHCGTNILRTPRADLTWWEVQ
jgi:hypothetical protein